AQRTRVRRHGQFASIIDAQAFALDPMQALREQRKVRGLGQQCQAMGEEVAQLVGSFTRKWGQYGVASGKLQATKAAFRASGSCRTPLPWRERGRGEGEKRDAFLLWPSAATYRQAKVDCALAISFSP